MRVLGKKFTRCGTPRGSLRVDEAVFSTMKRLGASEEQLLDAQGSLACTYGELGQLEAELIAWSEMAPLWKCEALWRRTCIDNPSSQQLRGFP